MKKNMSKEYLEAIKEFENHFRASVETGKKYEGIHHLPYNKVFASFVFTTITNRAVTLALATPYSSFNKNTIHWDYASIGGIVRSILENRLTFYYICIENVPSEEKSVRWDIFQLHDCCSRQRLFSHFPEEEREHNAGFEDQRIEITERIKANSYFCSLPLKERNKLLKGKNAFLIPLEDLAVKVGIEINDFRIYYQLMSSFNHSLPMSLLRMGEQKRGRGIHSQVEESYIIMFLELATKMLRDSTDEYIKLFNAS
ncbi:MAG: DUF5677 domain-containing protein [Marinomonas sp.]|uniref:DUF5677 domain-containing protein n=1 Tax=Marinomonas sp. TaxID=1904862 RepID=UPI003C76C922